MQQSTWNYIFLPFLAGKQSELAKESMKVYGECEDDY